MSSFDDVTEAAMREKDGVKWNRYPSDVLPCFVADMDFTLADPIRAVLRRQLEAGDYGYTRRLAERDLPEIYTAWAKRRFNWDVDPGSIVGLADIVQGIYLSTQLYAGQGEGVVTLTPTYPPLWRSIGETGRRLIACTLERGPERYEINFERLRNAIDPGVKMLLLCNPHNPTGRAFTKPELESIAEIVLKNDLTVLSDEIHADLVYAPHQHIPFASLGPDIAARTVTMTSATKSFNIAGLRFAIAIFGSPALRERFQSVPERVLGGLNSLGVVATEVAWRDCDDWLDALIQYLQANRDHLHERIGGTMPGIEMLKPEATFLSWLDCRNLPLNGKPFDHFLDVGRVGMSDGEDFGDGGQGFVRLNFATSRAVLDDILTRVHGALPS